MIRVIVTDIEGTTSSIRFVHEVLFPYAARHLEQFIRDHQLQPEVRAQLEAVSMAADVAPDDLQGQIDALQQWIREDRKATPLKTLQGMIWQAGYQQGDYQGHIYDDAAEYSAPLARPRAAPLCLFFRFRAGPETAFWPQ